MESLKKNKVLLSIFLVVLAVFVYYFFFYSGGSSSDSSSSDSSSGVVVGQNILDTLNQLSSVNIDTSLFSAAAWNALQDISAPVPSDAPGKPDLFAPLGQAGLSLSQSTFSTSTGSH